MKSNIALQKYGKLKSFLHPNIPSLSSVAVDTKTLTRVHDELAISNILLKGTYLAQAFEVLESNDMFSNTNKVPKLHLSLIHI